MELTNEFTVDAPIDTVWSALMDLARISPCIPGFELEQVHGDEFKGTMRVKVGAVTMRYESNGSFVERDESAHRAVMTAEGRELRGQGGVSATITSTLSESGGGTTVTMVTTLNVTGRAAQFGRGILADVSSRLVEQFVSCLETRVLAGLLAAEPPGAGVASAPSETDQPAVRRVNLEPAEPLDLLDVAGAPILKRLTIAAGVVMFVGLLVLLVRVRQQ